MKTLSQSMLWWSGRSRREQVMLGAMTALILAVGLWYGVVQPLREAREQAANRRHVAEQRLSLLTHRLEVARENQARMPADLRGALEQAGRKAEIYPQISPGTEGRVTVEASRVDPHQAMIWLEALDQAGVSLTALRIVSYEDGALSLTASTLSQEAGPSGA